MNHHFVRRLGVLVTAGAVSVAGLSLVSTGSAQAVVPGADPAPAARGAAWLAGTVPPSRILQTSYVYEGVADSYEDFGLTIDAATALTSVGSSTPLVSQMTDALTTRHAEYTDSYDVFNASSAAKLAAFLLDQGRSGAVVDGIVEQVRSSVSTSPGTAGRILNNPSTSQANPIGQAFAVHALARAGGAGQLATAQAYLLAQQCSAGFFRESFAAPDAPVQSCDGASPAASPSVDMTALAIQQLQVLKADPTVSAALARAVSWLQGQQRADGSFGTGTFAPNANSTGLAGTALGQSGDTMRAQSAALWLRGLQLANAGSCTPYAAGDDGAVVLDDQGLTEARSAPMDAVATSSAVRATGQALPALTWAPGGPQPGTTTIGSPEFERPGVVRNIVVTGAPGNTVCLTALGTATRLVLGADGHATRSITVPTKGATTFTAVDASGNTVSRTLTVLGKKTLKLALRTRTLTAGKQAVVKIGGLKPGELVSITLRGVVAKTAVANDKGRKTLRFKVTGKKAKPGTATIKVTGQFGYRSAKQTVRITR